MQDNIEQLNFRLLNISDGIEIPLIKEKSRGQYVSFGENNLYYEYLIDLYNRKSITHKAIIKRKIDMISGNGIERPINESQQFKEFIENSNDEDTLDVIVKKIAADYEILGSFAIGVIWNNKGDKITQLYHIPLQSLRYDKYYYKSEEEKYFWMSDDWAQRKYELTKIQEFSEIYKENKTQVLYVKEYTIGTRWYSIPFYDSFIKVILSEYEIAAWRYNQISNGFSAGYLISFNDGVKTPELMDRAVKSFEDNYTGVNAKQVIVAFANGKENAPTLQKIELNNADTRYTVMDASIRQTIFSAHAVMNPLLYGVFMPGLLGGRTELVESMELYQSSYIDFRQKDIENALNRLAKVNGITEPIRLNKYLL